jgi:hypothetical protein
VAVRFRREEAAGDHHARGRVEAEDVAGFGGLRRESLDEAHLNARRRRFVRAVHCGRRPRAYESGEHSEREALPARYGSGVGVGESVGVGVGDGDGGGGGVGVGIGIGRTARGVSTALGVAVQSGAGTVRGGIVITSNVAPASSTMSPEVDVT